ncbi:MAG: TRAP transporter substrate-binding protein DctP [Rhodocyclaceae bacterium]|nr:TRAP transporter substrate-binding protein DctP [Rhodocyclaceae bacterium]
MNRINANKAPGMKALGVAVLAVTVLAALPVFAQEKKLVFRVAHQFSPNDKRYDVVPWMEQVTKATHGEVQFEVYPSEQLGKAKDMMSLVQSGVADFALFVPSYVSEKMPLTAVLELPGMSANACQGMNIYAKLAREGGFLAQREYGPQGVRVLIPISAAPYRLMSSKKSIETLKDIEGMKVRVLAGAMELTMQRLKAVGIKMPGPELHQALSRGTLDGVIFSYGAIVSPSYLLPARFVTTDSFGSAVLALITSEKRWKEIPDPVKKIMLEAAEVSSQRICKGIDKEEDDALEKLKRNGVTVVKWSDADKKEMEAKIASVTADWAAETDKRGKPGTEAVKAALAARDTR